MPSLFYSKQHLLSCSETDINRPAKQDNAVFIRHRSCTQSLKFWQRLALYSSLQTKYHNNIVVLILYGLLYTRLARSDTDDKAGTQRNRFSMYLLVWWDQSFIDNDMRFYMYGEEPFHKYLDMGIFAISSHIFLRTIQMQWFTSKQSYAYI